MTASLRLSLRTFVPLCPCVFSSGCGPHPNQKTMSTPAMSAIGLKSTLHLCGAPGWRALCDGETSILTNR